MTHGPVAMPGSLEVEHAALKASYDAHVKSDDERYGRIETQFTQIMGVLNGIPGKLDSAMNRAHERIDDSNERISGLKIWVLSGGGILLLSILGYVLTTWGPYAK